MLTPKTLVVVADGTSAVLWMNHGQGVNLEHVENFAIADVALDGPSGSTPREQSVQDNDEATFIKHLVNKLNTMALNNKISGDVVIVADPTSLGQMRRQYHAKLSASIVRELPKTLVKATKQELEKALS